MDSTVQSCKNMGKNKQRCLASCQCGQTAVEVIGAPIVSTVCYCENCQAAGHAFERADGAPRTVGADGGTEYCLYRKDRVTVIRGGEYLQEHRLTPDSKTRRVVATCCNAPHVPGFHPRALADRVPVWVARRGAAAADAGHDQ